jgi:hypothetical protein
MQGQQMAFQRAERGRIGVVYEWSELLLATGMEQ